MAIWTPPIHGLSTPLDMVIPIRQLHSFRFFFTFLSPAPAVSDFKFQIFSQIIEGFLLALSSTRRSLRLCQLRSSSFLMLHFASRQASRCAWPCSPPPCDHQSACAMWQRALVVALLLRCTAADNLFKLRGAYSLKFTDSGDGTGISAGPCLAVAAAEE